MPRVAGSGPVRIVVSIAVIAALAAVPAVATAEPDDGSVIYGRYCLACHGTAGDGGGPAAPLLWPKPRDFTAGVYKWRTTALADGRTADDLATTIRDGAPGTAMPGFGGILTDAQVAAVVTTVIAFAPAAKVAKAGIAAPSPPAAASEDSVGRGKAAFSALGCVSC